MADAVVGPPASPALAAGLLLAAAGHLCALALPCPLVGEILAAMGASRSRAYELYNAILAALPSLSRPVGRPPSPPRETAPDTAKALLREVHAYLRDHVGAISGGDERARYSGTPTWPSTTSPTRS